jgi:KUP system potassium uptake protein
MLMTTFLMYFAAVKKFGWKKTIALPICIVFGLVDLAFFSANSVKFLEGGWFPIVLGGAIFTVMSTWYRGREILAARIVETSVPLDQFIASLADDEVVQVKGTAIYMARDTTYAPMALVHNLRHNRVIHENVIFLQVMIEERPTVSDDRRIEFLQSQTRFHHVKLRYGFMDEPNVPAALLQYRAMGAVFDLTKVTFFLGRELVLPTQKPGMALWRERLFSLITSVATRATAYFKIPTDQVVEIGYQVEI